MPENGIQGKDQLNIRRELVHRVENGRTVHEKLQHNRPQVVDIAEKDEKRGKNHANAQVEQQHGRDGIDKANEPPCELHVVDCAEHEENQKRQQEVQQDLDVDRKEEQVFRNVDLRKDARIPEETPHPSVGRLRKPVEHQKPAEEVGGVMVQRPPEKLLEHDLHHQEHQEGGKHTPPHSKNRTLVLLLEVALDQFLKQKPASLQSLKHFGLLYHTSHPCTRGDS